MPTYIQEIEDNPNLLWQMRRSRKVRGAILLFLHTKGIKDLRADLEQRHNLEAREAFQKLENILKEVQ